jgi:hypothetical protein
VGSQRDRVCFFARVAHENSRRDPLATRLSVVLDIVLRADTFQIVRKRCIFKPKLIESPEAEFLLEIEIGRALHRASAALKFGRHSWTVRTTCVHMQQWQSCSLNRATWPRVSWGGSCHRFYGFLNHTSSDAHTSLKYNFWLTGCIAHCQSVFAAR